MRVSYPSLDSKINARQTSGSPLPAQAVFSGSWCLEPLMGEHVDYSYAPANAMNSVSPLPSRSKEQLSPHVMVVDDEPSQRLLAREILEKEDYLVTEVDSGEQALVMLKAIEVDALLLDKRLPGIDGDEVCRRLRDDERHSLLPIIMLTGAGTPASLSKSLGAGANDFIRKPYNPAELAARVNAAVSHKWLTDELDSADSVLFALARIVEAKEKHTGDHCSRLAHMGVVFGNYLGLDARSVLALRRGGVMHDIGKIGIPDAILTKRGALDETEWSVMRRHPEIGYRLCSGLHSARDVLPIIRHHHERWDGGGYPDGLAGEEIPFLARVFQLLDIYDALSFKRAYKGAFPHEKVVAIMQEEAAKGWRDPELTRRFLDLLEEQPAAFVPPQEQEADLGVALFSSLSGQLDLPHSESSRE